MRKISRIVVLSIVLIVAGTFSAQAAIFDINLTYTGLSTSQQSIFQQAESYWEGVLTGYEAGINISSLNISAESIAMDGGYGSVGRASTSASSIGGYFMATDGTISIDSADINRLESNGRLYDVIRHEMAHVIGFGTLWTPNNLYADGTGQYTGAAGLAAYQQEFDSSATYVPVELEGGAGTAGGHWNEVLNGGNDTGIADANGNDMRYELMTGWLNSPIFVSNTTLMSFVDLGYTVAVPIPGAILLFGTGLLGIIGLRKRGKR